LVFTLRTEHTLIKSFKIRYVSVFRGPLQATCDGGSKFEVTYCVHDITSNIFVLR